MSNSYPSNCKECYNRIMGTCSLWRQVRVPGCNKHPKCPADGDTVRTEQKGRTRDE